MRYIILGEVADAIGAWPMEPDASIKARIAVLTSEMDTIHSANTLYWRSPYEAALHVRFAHECRKDRLEEIRRELALLQCS